MSCLVGWGTLDPWCHRVRGVSRPTMWSPLAWDRGGLWERAPASRALLLEYCLHILTAPCVLSDLNPCTLQVMSTNKSPGVWCAELSIRNLVLSNLGFLRPFGQ